MPYQIRAQFVGTLILTCADCGHLNRFRADTRSYRFRCHACKAIYVVGPAVYRVTKESRYLPPCDLAIPESRLGPDAESRGSLGDAEPIPLTPGEFADPSLGDQPVISAGVWRSNEPITIDVVDPTIDPRAKLYKNKELGSIWIAVNVAMGTRWIAQPLDGSSIDRVYVGRREWAERMEPLDGPKRIHINEL